MTQAPFVRVVGGAAVHGTVAAPPSKSATHRAFLLARQSTRTCHVPSPLLSADTRATLACLVRMGANVVLDGGGATFTPAPWTPPREVLACANSGTTLRLLTATAARLPAPVTLDGDASLRARPNSPLLDALRSLGARCVSRDGRAPLTVHGPLLPGAARLPASASSQYASALLLALPFLPGPSTLTLAPPVASAPYLEVTRTMAHAAGLRFEVQPVAGGLEYVVPGDQAVHATQLAVEADWSSAAFPLAAAAVTQGDVTVTGPTPHSPQGDRRIVQLLAAFGCKVDILAGQARVRGAPLHSPGTIDVADTPDLFPVLAAVAACASGTTTFTGGSQLRAKESDRIDAMAHGLHAAGIRTQTTPDGLVVHGGRPRAVQQSTRGDHRIHMALCILALAAPGATVLDHADSPAVSDPAFHDALRTLGASVTEVA